MFYGRNRFFGSWMVIFQGKQNLVFVLDIIDYGIRFVNNISDSILNFFLVVTFSKCIKNIKQNGNNANEYS